jgi:beta-lactamase regulating signal transducer with metallopeptidase domain
MDAVLNYIGHYLGHYIGQHIGGYLALWHGASSVAAMAAGTLFSAIWEGAVLAGCALLCLRMLPGLSAAARSVVWMNVFLLLVLLQVLPLVGGHGSGEVGRPAPLLLNPVWSVAIAGAWLALALLRAGQLLFSAVRLHRLAGRATVVHVDAELGALLRITTVGGKARAAELCTSAEVERPSVFGFMRPRILIPPALLERLTDAELRQVVVHEMEHLRRADDWTNLLQKLALVVFPLNPALVWVERRLCAERELACDDKVLSSSCGRKAYAVCLTHLAEYRMLRRGLSLALGAWERQSELVRRVHRILRRPGQTMSGRRTMVLTSGLIAAVAAGGFGLARSPQLVGFEEPGQARVAAAPEVRATYFEQPGMQAHAQMVKAVMPERVGSAAAAVKPVVKNATLRRTRRRSVAQQEAWVVMTGWSENSEMPQVVFTVARTGSTQSVSDQGMQGIGSRVAGTSQGIRRISYAAVRLPDGWLIVQI